MPRGSVTTIYKNKIPSPCIGVCKLDDQQTCTGCLRTIEEIKRWRTMSDQERQIRMRRIQKQLAQQENKS